MKSQSLINIDVAQNFSTFKFSSKIIDDAYLINDNQQYNQVSSIAYGFGYTNLRSSGLLFSGGLGFRKAGASLVYKKNSFLWELQYVDIKLGVGYLYNRWIVKPYVHILPYYAYLLSANQSSGLNYYDIKTDNALKSHDLGLFLSGGLKVPVSHYADIFAEYNYNLGLKNIETAPEQFLYNRGFAIKLGLSINITNFKKAQEQISADSINELNANVPALTPNSEIEENTINENTNTIPSSTIEDDGNKEFENSNQSNNINDSPLNSNQKTESKTEGSSNNSNVSNSQSFNDNNSSSPIEEGSTSNQTTKTLDKDFNENAANQNQKNNNTASNKSETTNENNEKITKKDDNVNFKIQLTAVKKPLGAEHPIYKNFKGDIKSEKAKDGWLRYYLGSYESYEDALNELREIKAKGALDDGGFIVAFKNNKKISVSDAKDLIK